MPMSPAADIGGAEGVVLVMVVMVVEGTLAVLADDRYSRRIDSAK